MTKAALPFLLASVLLAIALSASIQMSKKTYAEDGSDLISLLESTLRTAKREKCVDKEQARMLVDSFGS